MLGLLRYLLLETTVSRQSTQQHTQGATLYRQRGEFRQDDEDSTDPEDSEVADS